MTKIIDALKNLAVGYGFAETKSEVSGETVEDVINFIAECMKDDDAANTPE